MLLKYGSNLLNMNSEFEKVAKHNHQLNNPSKLPRERKKVLSLYKKQGYAILEKEYRKTRFIKNRIKVIRDYFCNK